MSSKVFKFVYLFFTIFPFLGRTYVLVRSRDAACLKEKKMNEVDEALKTITTYGFGALSIQKRLPMSTNQQTDCWGRN